MLACTRMYVCICLFVCDVMCVYTSLSLSLGARACVCMHACVRARAGVGAWVGACVGICAGVSSAPAGDRLSRSRRIFSCALAFRYPCRPRSTQRCTDARSCAPARQHISHVFSRRVVIAPGNAGGRMVGPCTGDGGSCDAPLSTRQMLLAT